MPQSNSQQFIACAAIFNSKGEILLSQRNNPSNPATHMLWQFPGGGIEHGENPSETAVRELNEELGIRLLPVSNRPLLVSSIVYEQSDIHICMILYGFSLETYTTPEGLDEETGAVKWFKLEELSSVKLLPNNGELALECWKIFKGLV